MIVVFTDYNGSSIGINPEYVVSVERDSDAWTTVLLETGDRKTVQASFSKTIEKLKNTNV